MIDYLSAKHVVVGASMFAALGLSVAMEPPQSVERPSINLKSLVPETMGEWSTDRTAQMLIPAPDVEAGLAKVYQETLSRTYVNPAGDRVMLSVAYSGDIDRQMDVHRPEFCYPAQGFDIVESPVAGTVSTPFGVVNVKRLVARQGPRVEPISYWITVGDAAATQGWYRKLLKLRFRITGQIPDGMLVRVSDISTSPATSFDRHEAFIRAMLQSLDPDGRKRFVGIL